MGFLQGLVLAVVERILMVILDRAQAEYEKRQLVVERDIERGEINEKNLQAYNQAKSRATRIGAALNLLNRTESPDRLRGSSKVPGDDGL